MRSGRLQEYTADDETTVLVSLPNGASDGPSPSRAASPFTAARVPQDTSLGPEEAAPGIRVPEAEQTYIPFHRCSVGQEEITAVTQVLKSQWLTTGPTAQDFEAEFAKYVNAKYALAVNSGTAALQLAVDALRLRAGDEVLVPTYTFTASAAVMAHFGAVPVLCDSIAGGFNLDPSDMASRITDRTRAVVAVHIAGLPCDLTEIHKIANQHGIHVIEDAAHALPASFGGQKVGSISELTAFSFYATKTITSGEGGMLTTNNEAYARRAAQMRLHGISGDAWKRYTLSGSWFYEVLDAGYKLNLCDILAAIGLAQLKKCDHFYQRRRWIAGQYLQRLADLSELEMPPADSENSCSAWHLFIIRTKPGLLNVTRDSFIEELKKLGIGTSVHFIPLHLHPFYAGRYGYARGDFPNAEDAYFRAISLPVFPDMDDAAVERIVNAVRHVVHAHRSRIYGVAA